MVKQAEISLDRRLGTITRDGNGNIQSIDVGGFITTIARDVNGNVESVTFNSIITTITRDGDGIITGWTVADV